jgi:hypothetical protein
MINIWQQQGFWYKPKTWMNAMDYLQSIWRWVDEDKVKQDIEIAKTKKITEADFMNKVKQAIWDNVWVPQEEIISWLLKTAKEKGYTIDWVDIDQELQALGSTQQTIQQPIQEEEKWFLWKAWDVYQWVWKWINNFIWWAVTQVPEIAWNISWFVTWTAPWFIADVLTPKEYEWLWDSFRNWWDKLKWLWKTKTYYMDY